MEITFNIQKLSDLGLTPNQYLVLHLIENYNAGIVSSYVINVGPFDKKDLEVLSSKGLVVIPPDGKFGLKDIEITDKFRKLAEVNGTKTEMEQDGEFAFYRQVFDLFPDHAKTGGYKVKSNFPEFCRRMAAFQKKHSIIPKTVILKATERYVATMRTKGYKYMKLATYFVFKGNMSDSVLYAECQEYIESLNDSKEDGKPKHGERLV